MTEGGEGGPAVATPQDPADQTAPADPGAAYGQALADALKEHQAALQKSGELIVRLEQQPELVGEEGWEKEMGEALRALDGAGAALASLPPPSDEIPKPAVYSWRRAQKHLERMGAETQALAGEWQEAVAAGDAGAVQQPRGRLHRIGAARHKAFQEIARASGDSRRPS
jgi:hypothetical protein